MIGTTPRSRRESNDLRGQRSSPEQPSGRFCSTDRCWPRTRKGGHTQERARDTILKALPFERNDGLLLLMVFRRDVDQEFEQRECVGTSAQTAKYVGAVGLVVPHLSRQPHPNIAERLSLHEVGWRGMRQKRMLCHADPPRMSAARRRSLNAFERSRRGRATVHGPDGGW